MANKMEKLFLAASLAVNCNQEPNKTEAPITSAPIVEDASVIEQQPTAHQIYENAIKRFLDSSNTEKLTFEHTGIIFTSELDSKINEYRQRACSPAAVFMLINQQFSCILN